MRFATIYTPSGQRSGPPSQEHMAKMGALIEKSIREGSLVYTGPLGKSERGFRVSYADGKAEIINGPFPGSTFAKASGFAIIEAADEKQALAFIQEFLAVAGDGVSEVIPLADIPVRT
ncbi:MAG: hypothetical protein JNJ73_00575 [Hyphomonadaceae bacterium]|nr:hypothetical protein [Hyphomonadaceae bacterium]